MRPTSAYSPVTVEALRILGLQIAAARKSRRWTLSELAERAGISTPTLRNIERGEPTTAIGAAFEVATLVGVPLFDAEADDLLALRRRAEDRLALLPRTVRLPERPARDDF
jgi:transcriptional regulator with XRE-family HTH domain